MKKIISGLVLSYLTFYKIKKIKNKKNKKNKNKLNHYSELYGYINQGKFFVKPIKDIFWTKCIIPKNTHYCKISKDLYQVDKILLIDDKEDKNIISGKEIKTLYSILYATINNGKIIISPFKYNKEWYKCRILDDTNCIKLDIDNYNVDKIILLEEKLIISTL